MVFGADPARLGSARRSGSLLSSPACARGERGPDYRSSGVNPTGSTSPGSETSDGAFRGVNGSCVDLGWERRRWEGACVSARRATTMFDRSPLITNRGHAATTLQARAGELLRRYCDWLFSREHRAFSSEQPSERGSALDRSPGLAVNPSYATQKAVALSRHCCTAPRCRRALFARSE